MQRAPVEVGNVIGASPTCIVVTTWPGAGAIIGEAFFVVVGALGAGIRI